MATATAPAPARRTAQQQPAVPRANVRAANTPFPDTEFKNIPNVPVFCEHETVVRRGPNREERQQVEFGRAELQAICDRCNRRIQETGDYAAITIGHTPSPEAMQAGTAKFPEVVGFAGPFRLGVLGEWGTRQRWAILADFHIFLKDAAVVQKNPRRSPELFLEDKFGDMFLDPIALLGAEAPRLDMGLLLYSAYRHGRIIEKYAAVSPGPGNTFIPSDDDLRRRNYSSEAQNPANPDIKGRRMLAPEEVKQIVDALEQQSWVQWCKSQMQTQAPAGANNQAGSAAEGSSLDAGTGDGTAPLPGAPAVDAPPPPAPAAEAAPPAPAAPAGPAAAPAPKAPPIAPKDPADKEKDAARKYAADASVDGKETVAATGTVDGSEGGDAGGGKVAEKTTEISIKYSRALHRQGELEHELEVERGRRTDAERASRLSELRRTRAFDLDEEREVCKYGSMTDSAFDKHVKLIEKNYREIPIDTQVQTFDEALDPNRPGGQSQVEKYSKHHSDRAMAICEDRAMRGEAVDYGRVLADVKAGRIQ